MIGRIIMYFDNMALKDLNVRKEFAFYFVVAMKNILS